MAISRKQIEDIFTSTFDEKYLDIVFPEIFIHYPEFYIQNESGSKHKIHDLYIKIIFNGRNIVDIQGARSTYTPRELSTSYTHSHLQSSTQPGKFSSFCKGAILNTMIMDYNSETGAKSRISKLNIIANFLDTFVATESLKGGPFKKMKTMYFLGDNSSVYSIRNIDSLNDEQKEYVVNNITDVYQSNLSFSISLQNNTKNIFYNVLDKIKDLNIAGDKPVKIGAVGINNQQQIVFKNKKIENKLIDEIPVEIETSTKVKSEELNSQPLRNEVYGIFKKLALEFVSKLNN